jgi:hypothetical protein
MAQPPIGERNRANPVLFWDYPKAGLIARSWYAVKSARKARAAMTEVATSVATEKKSEREIVETPPSSR